MSMLATGVSHVEPYPSEMASANWEHGYDDAARAHEWRPTSVPR
jgi:hypothetical protein